MVTFKGNRHRHGWVSLCVGMGILWVFTLFLTAGFEGEACARSKKTKGEEVPKADILNLHGKVIGSVDKNGTVFNRYGRSVGTVDSAGTVYNVNKTAIGNVDADGKILNQSGMTLGTVDENGDVFNRNGRKVGSVKAAGNTLLSGGAARLLLLQMD